MTTGDEDLDVAWADYTGDMLPSEVVRVIWAQIEPDPTDIAGMCLVWEYCAEQVQLRADTHAVVTALLFAMAVVLRYSGEQPPPGVPILRAYHSSLKGARWSTWDGVARAVWAVVDAWEDLESRTVVVG